VALADILNRIENDADEEAFCIVDESKREAEWLVDQARGKAEEATARILAEAEVQATREQETTLANARLQARDRAVAARRELTGRVLRRAEEMLVGLRDDAYAELIASRLVALARGGESVRFGAADRERLASSLRDAVARAARDTGRTVDLEFGGESADIEHGVVLVGDRMSVEVSPAALVRERSEELQALAARVLFPDDPSETDGTARSDSEGEGD
jgi:vacuolar-type H+-ATPase subunit E/Vma4